MLSNLSHCLSPGPSPCLLPNKTKQSCRAITTEPCVLIISQIQVETHISVNVLIGQHFIFSISYPIPWENHSVEDREVGSSFIPNVLATLVSAFAVDWNGWFFIVGDCAKNYRCLASLVLKTLMAGVPLPILWDPKYPHSALEFTWGVVALLWDNFCHERKFWATSVSYLQGSLYIMWAVCVWASIPLVLHGVGQKLFLLDWHSNGVVGFQ